MKKMKSWYIGPVIGATSARNGWPVTVARTKAKTMNAMTYVTVMCSRPRVWRITEPNSHTMAIGRRLLPHCTLRLATASGASTSIATIAKLVGLNRCRPPTRITYFEVIAIAEVSANGQNAGDRTSMPTLMPDT